MREIERLTPRQSDALRAAARLPLRYRAADPDAPSDPAAGWSNTHGGPFNSATIGFLRSVGFLHVTGPAAEARISEAGRRALVRCERLAA